MPEPQNRTPLLPGLQGGLQRLLHKTISPEVTEEHFIAGLEQPEGGADSQWLGISWKKASSQKCENGKARRLCINQRSHLVLGDQMDLGCFCPHLTPALSSAGLQEAPDYQIFGVAQRHQ